MTATQLAIALSAGSFLLSVLGSSVIVTAVIAGLRSDVRALQAGRAELATKGDVQGVKDQVTEIKGMFRLVLRPEALASLDLGDGGQ